MRKKYKPLDIPAGQFLSAFFGAEETVCLRVFDDRKIGSFKGSKLTCEAGKIDAVMEKLKQHNGQNRGIYFVVNFGGHEDIDITRVNAQFVECDNLSIDEQLARIVAFPLPPSIIVKTKKSLHSYWLVRGAVIDGFRHIQKQLVAQFSGDPACVNESRVFRLPGFYHCKAEPVMVECIKFDPDLRYTQAELAAALPPIPDESAGKMTALKGTQRGLPLVSKRCLFVKHCKDNPRSLPENLWYAMITNLAVFTGGEREIHTLSADYPKYQYDETQEKITHFLDSGTKPITCSTIAERGFSCPKAQDGSCGCKAPAVLSFKPLDVGEMRGFLSQYPKSEAATDNASAAREFVTEYLYNAEPVISDSFISHELREHFGFKAADIKSLLSLQKETHKKFQENWEARRVIGSTELPPWYEQTGRSLRFMPGLLAEHMEKEVKAFYSAEQYYHYRNGVYQAISDLEARSIVKEHLIARHTSLANITDAEGQWRLLILKSDEELNTNPYIINVKNGLYHVLSNELQPHSPEYYSTYQLNVNYTPNADCPLFKRFLAESLYPDDVPMIQEMLGYFLVPVNKAQKAFVIVGEAGAGKSTLLLTLNQLLLGPKNVSNVPWQHLNERFKIAELVGKLANIFADLPTKNIDDNGVFKALVGEDYLTAERKNKDAFTFKPYARLLFSCNAIPRNYGDKSEGFYRRLIIIRFTNIVPEAERDAELMDKFTAEADGIFLFAVEGLRRLIKNKFRFNVSENSQSELRRYRIDSNSVLSFVEECCEFEADAATERGALFNRYKEYCHDVGLNSVSQKTFNRDIERAYPEINRGRDKVGSRRTWVGIHVLE